MLVILKQAGFFSSPSYLARVHRFGVSWTLLILGVLTCFSLFRFCEQENSYVLLDARQSFFQQAGPLYENLVIHSAYGNFVNYQAWGLAGSCLKKRIKYNVLIL